MSAWLENGSHGKWSHSGNKLNTYVLDNQLFESSTTRHAGSQSPQSGVKTHALCIQSYSLVPVPSEVPDNLLSSSSYSQMEEKMCFLIPLLHLQRLRIRSGSELLRFPCQEKGCCCLLNTLLSALLPLVVL